MSVVAFVKPELRSPPEPRGAPGVAHPGSAASRLRVYACGIRLCLKSVLALWGTLQIACLLSLFLHFRAGIVAGTVDGTLAFRYLPPLGYLAPNMSASAAFIPHAFPQWVALAYAAIAVIASAPFCAALHYLAELFELYAQGLVFTKRNTALVRRVGHLVMATGYLPLALGPFAHSIGILKPVTGVSVAMIGFIVAGLAVLAVSNVAEIGDQMRQDQEGIL